jgi:hypothetical protein
MVWSTSSDKEFNELHFAAKPHHFSSSKVSLNHFNWFFLRNINESSFKISISSKSLKWV